MISLFNSEPMLRRTSPDGDRSQKRMTVELAQFRVELETSRPAV